MSMMIMIGHSAGANFRENVWGHDKGKERKTWVSSWDISLHISSMPP